MKQNKFQWFEIASLFSDSVFIFFRFGCISFEIGSFRFSSLFSVDANTVFFFFFLRLFFYILNFLFWNFYYSNAFNLVCPFKEFVGRFCFEIYNRIVKFSDFRRICMSSIFECHNRIQWKKIEKLLRAKFVRILSKKKFMLVLKATLTINWWVC